MDRKAGLSGPPPGPPIAIAFGGVTITRQILGKAGENLAVAELTRRGYAILERRYRTRYGEIDIIGDDHGTVVFIEVRARATREFGTAAESVTSGKKRRLMGMAVEYLARRHLTCRPCRFDVVAIDGAEGPSPKITVFTYAFDANG